MCGFVALFEANRRFDSSLLEAMGSDIWHRGPDSGGSAVEPGLALVFRRLAILDPKPGADQPMTSADGRHTIVFNGEIYNYRRLRAELEGEGVAFRTTGDTEVLLEGYRHWGEGVLDRLEGMYAFAIIDRVRNAAVVARDGLGIKPLYVARAGKLMGFASEMRPLTRLVGAEPDPRAVADLLTYGWAAGRLSNLRGIEMVLPGTVFTIPLDGGQATERRYFDILDTLRHPKAIAEAEARERIEQVLKQSVTDHLASDVGYTLQLSGGVDSSLLAALTAAQAGRRVSSFSVHIPGYRHDERPWRDMVVSHLNLDHQEVSLDGRAFADALPRAVKHMEGPVPHGGCVMLMLLCDTIRRHSKVVLTGEGADELFGGYERYALWPKLARQEHLSRLPFIGLLPDRWKFRGVHRLRGRDAAVHASVYHDSRHGDALFPDLRPKPGAREEASGSFHGLPERLFAVDQIAYLQSLLVRQDKMSMAASVEARVPFVHLPLLRLANSLPRRMLVPGGVTKPVLKRIAEQWLPAEVIHRRKIGLWLPYGEWLADDGALGRYLGLLTGGDSRLAAYGDAGRLRRYVDSARKDPTSANMLLRLINMEVWMRGLSGWGV